MFRVNATLSAKFPMGLGGARQVSSLKMTVNRELWTFTVPLYSMKPSFLNLFMK